MHSGPQFTTGELLELEYRRGRKIESVEKRKARFESGRGTLLGAALTGPALPVKAIGVRDLLGRALSNCFRTGPVKYTAFALYLRAICRREGGGPSIDFVATALAGRSV